MLFGFKNTIISFQWLLTLIKHCQRLLANLHLVSNICYDTANFHCFALSLCLWIDPPIDCFWLCSKFTTRTLFLTISTFHSSHYWTFTNISRKFQHAMTVWFSPNIPFLPQVFSNEAHKACKNDLFLGFGGPFSYFLASR